MSWLNRKFSLKDKAVPLQAWSGREGSRKLSFPDLFLLLSIYSYCRLCILIVVYVFLLLSMYSSCLLCILIVVYVFL